MIHRKPIAGPPPVRKPPISGSNLVVALILLSIFGYVGVMGYIVVASNKAAEKRDAEAIAAREREARKNYKTPEQQAKELDDELKHAAIDKGELWCYALITEGTKASVDWISGDRETGYYNDNGESLLVWMRKKGTAVVLGTKIKVTGYAKVQCWRQPKKGEDIVCLPLEQWVR